ncbi:transmembrane 9 superfamily member 5-like [Diospyros lotus]|uniref:transmembrane 9 superfamily member 5-like n=1 Tax=Diospyros lotus TaxID=55363 RepID=UPI00225B2DF2|nr:transmembrane 9 superfamily member 5-like [Diospyros lotus]
MAKVVLVSILVMLIAALAISVGSLNASQDVRRYKHGDDIPLFANKVYPRDRPCAAEPYFKLPFCRPSLSKPSDRVKSLEEVLQGDCFTHTQYRLQFLAKRINRSLCKKNLTIEEVAMFRRAIRDKFEYQMYWDRFLIQGVVGQVRSVVNSSSPRYYLVKHIDFLAKYNGRVVTNIEIASDFNSAVDITEDAPVKVEFTYSLYWNITASHAVQTSNDTALMPINIIKKQGQGSSVEFILSLFIGCYKACIGFLLAFTLSLYSKNIFGLLNRFLLVASKQIHGNACSCVSYASLHCAVVGIGTQLFFLICGLFALAYAGFLHPCNHTEYAVQILVMYYLTSGISGYVAASFYRRHHFQNGWAVCVLQTGALYLVPTLSMILVMDVLAEAALGVPVLSNFEFMIIAVLGLGAVTNLYLVIGAFIPYAPQADRPGASSSSRSQHQHESSCPRATNKTPTRVLVHRPFWCWRTASQMFVAGLVHFMLVSSHVDILYASLWNLRVCGAFITLLTDFFSLSFLTFEMGLLFAWLEHYMQPDDDHNWQWRCVLRGGSTAIFMLAYGIRFHIKAYPEDGMVKLVIFMGYNACICYALFLILGTIDFYSSLLVHKLVEAPLAEHEG